MSTVQLKVYLYVPHRRLKSIGGGPMAAGRVVCEITPSYVMQYVCIMAAERVVCEMTPRYVMHHVYTMLCPMECTMAAERVVCEMTPSYVMHYVSICYALWNAPWLRSACFAR